MRYLWSIGVIPADCTEDYIVAGDPDSFGGKDLTLELDYDEDSLFGIKPLNCCKKVV